MKNLKRPERNRPVVNKHNLWGSKPLPHANDLEEVVLGAIMLEKHAIDVVGDMLLPDVFYADRHKCIFRAMQSLFQRGHPIDILTVVEELKSKGDLEQAGGPFYVTSLTNSVVSSANLDTHARIILQKYIRREIISIGARMVGEGMDESMDVFDLLELLESQLLAVGGSPMRRDFSSLDDGMVQVIHRLETLRMQDETVTGVPSGFAELDQVTHGWQNTDLIILAARPAVGKTAFALNLVRNAALHPSKPTPVGFFSLEMSRGQLIQRLLAAESQVFLDRLTSGRLDNEWMAKLYREGVQRLNGAPIYIDDTAGLTMFELRSKARRMKHKHRVGLIVVDYLQLMTGDTNKSDNREREISKISRELKKLAKDLEIPIIALSQLSREVEKRGKGQRVPQLSDLRESGAIEQDADVVVFLYRPSDDEILQDMELENKAMVKIAKHRNGKLAEIVLKFFGDIQKWMGLQEGDRYEQHIGRKKRALPGYRPIDYSAPVHGDDDIEDLPF